MADAGSFERYQRVRDWFVVDVQHLGVHAPTMLMAIPGAEWILSETAFDDLCDGLSAAHDEFDVRCLNAIKGMVLFDDVIQVLARS